MMLSDKAVAEIRALQARYPVPRSALGPALNVAQREVGWLPPEVMKEVAALFALDPAEVGEFASFYHMLNTHRQPGEYHVEICTNVPCMLRGSSRLADRIKVRLGLDWGETSADGKFTLGSVECMGACGTAPMFACTERATGKIRYFEELDSEEKLNEALSLIESGHAFDTCERWPTGPNHHGGRADTNFLLARVDKPDSHTLESYLADGGYDVAALSSAAGRRRRK
jgi:NADH:ubiquinone oxidoreductase subunit E